MNQPQGKLALALLLALPLTGCRDSPPQVAAEALPPAAKSPSLNFAPLAATCRAYVDDLNDAWESPYRAEVFIRETGDRAAEIRKNLPATPPRLASREQLEYFADVSRLCQLALQPEGHSQITYRQARSEAVAALQRSEIIARATPHGPELERSRALSVAKAASADPFADASDYREGLAAAQKANSLRPEPETLDLVRDLQVKLGEAEQNERQAAEVRAAEMLAAAQAKEAADREERARLEREEAERIAAVKESARLAKLAAEKRARDAKAAQVALERRIASMEPKIRRVAAAGVEAYGICAQGATVKQSTEGGQQLAKRYMAVLQPVTPATREIAASDLGPMIGRVPGAISTISRFCQAAAESRPEATYGPAQKAQAAAEFLRTLGSL